MKKDFFLQLPAALVLLLGLTVIAGWVWHIPLLVSFIPANINMVFNTALCFVIAGLALLLPNRYPKIQHYGHLILGSAILIFSVVIISQTIFQYSLGIDELLIKVWLTDQNLFPGRMALNTGITFIIFSMALILMQYRQYRVAAIIFQVFNFIVFLSSSLVFIGYLLHLEFLYNWYQFSRMAIHTAIGFLLLSLCMWLNWIYSKEYKLFYKDREDKKILFNTAVILFVIAVIATLAGFAISKRQSEQLIIRVLQQTLQIKKSNFVQMLEQSLAQVRNMQEADLIQLVAQKETLSNADKTALLKLMDEQKITDLQIFDTKKNVLANFDKNLNKSKAIIPINMPFAATLLWRDGLSIRFTAPIYKQAQMVGYFITEWPLNKFKQIVDKFDLGKTGELRICASLTTKNTANCLPTQLLAKPSNLSFENAGQRLPMRYALEGQSGANLFDDYRHQQVIAAYSPIDDLGLGIVVKIDTNEFYQPISNQLQLILPLLLLTIGIGLFLLYWQVLPLVRRIVLSEKKLIETEKRFRAAFDYASIGMAIVSLEGCWLKVNQALCRIVGYNESELLKLDFQSITYPDDLNKDMEKARQLLVGEVQHYDIEKRYIHKNGNVVWVLLSGSLVRDSRNEPLYFISQIQDITTRKYTEEKLKAMAYSDVLTGLANRAQLEHNLKLGLISAFRHQQRLAVIFLDLDNFKNINDTLGHDAGDQLLQVIARCLKKCTRDIDTVARIGGDEFVILIPEIENIASTGIVAQKVIAELARPIAIKGHELHITTSMGISCYPEDGLEVETLLKNADMALYRAKLLGRNNYQFCTKEMTSNAKEKMVKENALQQALNRNEFLLHYQPIVNIQTNKIIGVEAFLRWDSQQFGLLSSGEIIQLAEGTGLIYPLGEWVLKSAVQQLKAWCEAGLTDLLLSINISIHQFRHADFINQVTNILQQTQVNVDNIEFQLTENLFINNPHANLVILRELTQLGIKITIDNFGTGYTSLNYLQQLTVNKINIDRKFISYMLTDPKHNAIVKAAIAMATSLNIKTRATGIESTEQLKLLTQYGCTEVQGYYISVPLPVEQVTTLLMGYRNSAIRFFG